MDPSKFTPQQMHDATQQMQQQIQQQMQQQMQQQLMQSNNSGNRNDANNSTGGALQQQQQQLNQQPQQQQQQQQVPGINYGLQNFGQSQANGLQMNSNAMAPGTFKGQSQFQQQLSALQGQLAGGGVNNFQQLQQGSQQPQGGAQNNQDQLQGQQQGQQGQGQEQGQQEQQDQSQQMNNSSNNNQVAYLQGQQQQGGPDQSQPNLGQFQPQMQGGSSAPQMQAQTPAQVPNLQQQADTNVFQPGQGQQQGQNPMAGMPGGFNQNALLSAAAMSGNMGFNLQQIQQLQLAQQLMAAGLPSTMAFQPNAAAMSNPLMMAGLANPMMSQFGGLNPAAGGNPMNSIPNMANANANAGQGGLGLLGGLNGMNAATSDGTNPAVGLSASKQDSAPKQAQPDWAEPFAGKGKKEPPFPLKLHQILSNPEFQECICWNPHGRSWRILKPPVFEQLVIPLYFRHAKYASFMRQVNGWGFKRIVSGNDHNSYFHELFLRDYPQLCLKMKRIRKGEKVDDENSEGEDKTANKAADNKEEDGSNGSDEGQKNAAASKNEGAVTENSLALSSVGLSTGNTGLATAPPGYNALAGLEGQLQNGGVGAGLALQQQAPPTLAPLANAPGGIAIPSAAPEAANNSSVPGAGTPFAGLDNAALLKLQEALQSGGATAFIQQQQQQQQQQQPQQQQPALNPPGSNSLNLTNLNFLQGSVGLAQQLQAATRAPTLYDNNANNNTGNQLGALVPAQSGATQQQPKSDGDPAPCPAAP